MTRQEALAEAQQRWGKDAYAEYHMDSRHYWVGESTSKMFHLCAYGDSWEAAFRDADARSSR